jgi:UDP-N-acetylglucosamine--N-acetylmuramyl-(pentapeptide) pyrophosphoryl-undecaprenol N-acetylglucosamine transferase
MAVAELSVVKKPVIFVPFPFATEDHQTVNAKRLVDKNAAMIVTDQQVKEQLLPTIIALAKDENKQNELKKNIAAFAKKNADEVIAKQILRTVHD